MSEQPPTGGARPIQAHPVATPNPPHPESTPNPPHPVATPTPPDPTVSTPAPVPQPPSRFPAPGNWSGSSAEPTPWGLGLFVGTVCALFAAFLLVGIYGLIGNIQAWLGVLAILVVSGGLGWTLWEFRHRPVWRWIVWGTLLGFLAGVASSIALLAMGR